MIEKVVKKIAIGFKSSLLSGALVCLFLSACDQQAPAQVAASPSSAVIDETGVASADAAVGEHKSGNGADMLVTASSHAATLKPGASVELANNSPLQLQAGVADVFNVELKTPITAGRMHVSLTAAEPLNLMSELDEFDFDLGTDGQYLLPITLQADENGRYYLNLQIELVNGEQSQARSLDVIVQVGPAVKTQVNYEQKPSTGKTGLVELPATEQVH